MTGDPERDKLDRLSARIRQAEAAPKPEDDNPSGGAGADAFKASQVGFEFVGAVVGCAAIGWLIDHFAGTGPWGVLGMIFVGFAAGMFNVWRALNSRT